MIRIPIGMRVMYFSSFTKYIKTEIIIEMFATRIKFLFVWINSDIWLNRVIKAKLTAKIPINKSLQKKLTKIWFEYG